MPIPTLNTSYKQMEHVSNADSGNTAHQEGREELRSKKVADIKMNDSDSNSLPSSSRPSLLPNDGDVVKRRSLLPQPGQAYNTRLPEAASVTKGSQEQLSGRLRPRSMYQSTLARSEQDGREKRVAAPNSTRGMTAISKPSDASTAGLSRSRSLRKPGIPTQSAQPVGSAGHSRTQSTSNLPTQRKDTIYAKPPIEKHRSLQPASGNSSHPSNVSMGPTSTAPRTSARLAGLSRIGSVNHKSEASQIGPATRTAPRNDNPAPTQPRRRDIMKDEAPAAARPAFTTLQQHFTPRKSGKAATSTFLQPAPAPNSMHLSPEVITLQSELLQLHLLHSRCAETERCWQSSAKRALQKKFDEVATLHGAMIEQECIGREQKNLEALLEWSNGKQSMDLVQCLQVLSGPLHELPLLVEADGRLQHVIQEFEQWMLRVDRIRTVRAENTKAGDTLESASDLGDSWRAETTAITRKVTSYVRDLDQLQQPSPGSSIACMIDTCNALLKGTLDELHAMQLIEAKVNAEEKEWVEECLQAIAQDVTIDWVDKYRETAAWQM